MTHGVPPQRERRGTALVRRELEVGGLPSKVWTGGEGEPLLLLHGGWGGAEMHWSAVWELLAERFRVVAPELPGIAAGTAGGPRSYDGFADWVAGVLDALEVPRAWCVGNSMGAAVGWQLAARAPDRLKGLVLVDGTPPMDVPALFRRLIPLTPFRQLWTAWFARWAFSARIVPLAFADPARAPAELTRVVAAPPAAQLALIREMLLTGKAAPAPRVPVLVLWGEQDRVPGVNAAVARKLHAGIPGARLAFVAGAGHLPQAERPREFADAIATFVAAAGEGR